MDLNLAGRVALVTGASNGIGRAIARTLAAEGATVALTYHQDASAAHALLGQITAAGGRATAHRYDLGHEPEAVVDDVVSAHGGLDVLVANAVEWPHGRSIADSVTTNLAGTLATVERAFPALVDRQGRVVVVSSNVATDGMPGSAVYGSIKAGLLGAVASWSAEYAPRGVLVNAVLPGLTLTDRAREHIPEGIRRAEADRTPTRRLTDPDDVADAIAWLVSSRNRQVTGQQLRVTGGR
ncbi:MAG: SDR family oxidoreductase [Dermatophilaceae bacterium]